MWGSAGNPGDSLDGRIVVLADVHGNATAFRVAVALARATGFDELIVLGDLLTYGCDVPETLDIAHELAIVDGATFILGNHEELYGDGNTSAAALCERLPPWLSESIAWTRDRLYPVDLLSAFAWQDQFVSGRILFAHANPFACRDWAYLNSISAFASAADRLREDGWRVGVFGHTHRHRVLSAPMTVGRDLSLRCDAEVIVESAGGTVTAITTAGIGQPRDSSCSSQMLVLDPTPQGLSLQSVIVPYDLDRHLASIDRSNMSEATRTRLKAYFLQ